MSVRHGRPPVHATAGKKFLRDVVKAPPEDPMASSERRETQDCALFSLCRHHVEEIVIVFACRQFIHKEFGGIDDAHGIEDAP